MLISLEPPHHRGSFESDTTGDTMGGVFLSFHKEVKFKIAEEIQNDEAAQKISEALKPAVIKMLGDYLLLVNDNGSEEHLPI